MINLSSKIVDTYKYLFTSFNIALMFLIGSRKSAKTKHIALRIVTRILMDKDYNAVCFRKVNKTIWDSIKTELDWAITTLGVWNYFIYNGTRQEYCYLPNKTYIKLRSIETDTNTGKTKISGLNVVNGWIKDCWLEEAYEFTYNDFVMLTGTLRGGFYSIIFSCNPWVSTHWLIKWALKLLPQKFSIMKEKGEQFKYDPDGNAGSGILVHWTNWTINTKIDPADIKDRLAEKERDPKRYYTTGYGMAGSPEGTILGDLLENIQYTSYNDAVKSISILKGGIDYGLIKDATTCTIGGFTAGYKEIVMIDEYWHSNGEQTYNKGKWVRYDIEDYVRDVLKFYVGYIDIIRLKGGIKVEVDNAEHGFIQLLNKEANIQGVGLLIKFNPSYKPKIEDRVVFERALLSMKKLWFVEKSMPLLYNELENLQWKLSNTNQHIRDEASYSNHITDNWEYMWSREMYKMIPKLGN